MFGGSRALGIALMAVLCFCFFSVDYRERRELASKTPGGPDATWRSLSVDATRFAKTWYREGAWNIGFGLHFRPEPEPRVNLNLYTSYPPGFLIPVHVYSRLVGKEPTLETLMVMSLWLHVFTAFFIGLFVFLSVPPNSSFLSFLAGSASAGIYFFSKAAYFFYPGTWWPDSLAPTYFVLILLYEFHGKSTFRGLDWLLFFAAAFTDWLLFPLLGMVAFFRWKKGDGWRKACAPLFAGAIAVFIHLYFVVSSGRMGVFRDKVAKRISYETFAGFNVPSVTRWIGYLDSYFWSGAIWIYLVAGFLSLFCFGYLVVRTKRQAIQPILFFTFLLVPCFFHNLVLMEHYDEHPYNVLKVAMLLAAFPSVIYVWGRTKVNWCVALVCLLFATHLFLARDRSYLAWSSASQEDLETCRNILPYMEGNRPLLASSHLLAKRLGAIPECYYLVSGVANSAWAIHEARASLAGLPAAEQSRSAVHLLFEEDPSSNWKEILEDKPLVLASKKFLYRIKPALLGESAAHY